MSETETSTDMKNYMGTITAFGCIAEHLGHSFSGEIHHLIGLALQKAGLAEAYPYVLQELRPDEVDSFMRAHTFSGINVTIPYKQTVIPYLDELTDIAREIGAVNTVVNRDGRLIGHNTDFYGMNVLLSLANIDIEGKKVLIFGTGGTSKTATAVARHGGAREILKFSRKAQEGCLTYDVLSQHLDAEVIINTTPVGMYPNDENCPLPADIALHDFPSLCGVLDAIYHPLRTELVSEALRLGIPATGGLPMLVAQAVAATERFLNIDIPTDIVRTVTAAIEAQKQNVVLIGMPASGKTTVGRLLSERLQMPLFDTDEEITRVVGATSAELIQARGEHAFREIESEVIRDMIAPMSGVIVATGGGAILRDENVRRLKRNGKLIFLDRSLESLETTADRPLSSDRDALRRRYEERYPRYCAVADMHLTVADGEKPEITAERVLENT